MEEFEKGFEFLKKFRHERIVTIFSSHFQKEGNPLYEGSRELARLLAQEGIVVTTDRGPGVMEAANWEQFSRQKKTLAFFSLSVLFP